MKVIPSFSPLPLFPISPSSLLPFALKLRVASFLLIIVAVRYLLRTLKSLLFWSYGRSTWQYDILCALILAFIFLTPQGWFKTGELKQGEVHPTPSARAYLLVEPTIKADQIDKNELERRVRQVTGRPDAAITDWRAQRDEQGRLVAYEVDIR